MKCRMTKDTELFLTSLSDVVFGNGNIHLIFLLVNIGSQLL